MRATIERELKLEPDPQFELPIDLGRQIESRLFTSTYYDTAARSLLRSGITLRRRVENGLSRWQLKLPREGYARAELEAPGGPAGPPPELRRLLVAHLRHGALAPVATLRTRRVGMRVADGDHELAEVTLDAVDILEGQRQAGGFREIEIELLEGDDDDLDRLARVLRRAGAHASDGRSKVARAIDAGPDDSPPPFLAVQLAELEGHDPGVRVGDEPEDVHRMRVAIRRTRAVVGKGEFAVELKWLASLLGPVRDLDVLLAHLRESVALLDDDKKGGDAIVAALEEEREGHRDSLVAAMDSDRYLALLERFSGDVLDPEPDAAAAFAALRDEIKGLPDDPPDDQLHALRKTAKKARYAAEVADAGTKLVNSLKAMQDVIGEHQDAVVAEERLRKLAKARTAVAAGRLIERERSRKQEMRDALPGVLDDVLARGKKAF